MEQTTIRETTLRELSVAGSVSSAQAVGRTGGFVLAINCATNERVLASARGCVRIFSNLTTLAGYLQKLGISRFEVNTTGYVPGRVRKARPDRAVAMRRTRTRPIQPPLFEARS